MSEVRIERVDERLLETILPLIADYQVFYEQTPDTARNRAFFGRFTKENPLGVQFAALDPDGAPLGFATLYVLPSSLSGADYCYLSDLFTVRAARGRGVARALLASGASWARARGLDQVDWLTARSNATAQRLYDRLTPHKSEWYYYSWHLSRPDSGATK